MGLFSNKREGGMMDVIRCDQEDYLIWKWTPAGEVNSSRKENAIRYGSSLRVKDGELAVFVYKQDDGGMQDFIEGPFDKTIKTENFPVLTSIVGAAFGGSSPFQAEIYYINLSENLSLKFVFDDVKLSDPRVPNVSVPAKVKCNIIFHIDDYRKFIKLNRMRHFTMADFKYQVEAAVKSIVTSAVGGAPKRLNAAIDTLDQNFDEINAFAGARVAGELAAQFGMHLKGFYMEFIEVDTESKQYEIIEKFNAQYGQMIDEQTRNIMAENQAYRQNVSDQQSVNIEHQAEAFRIQREETQRAQRLQTESANLTAHQLNIQGEVAGKAADSLGQLGSNPGSGFGGEGGGGMNPAAMMAGMMMGGAVGGGMSNMMGNMMQGVNSPQPPAPPAGATAQYFVSVGGQQAGPYTMAQLGQMITAGQVNGQSYIWRNGMAAWEAASNMPELAGLFAAVPPPPPAGGPPTPPAPPQGSL